MDSHDTSVISAASQTKPRKFSGVFLVTGRDAAELFDAAEAPLDPIAVLVELVSKPSAGKIRVPLPVVVLVPATGF